MKPHEQGTSWSMLEANAHLEEVQEIIRSEISRGMIRVVPSPGGGIHIIPMVTHASPERPPLFRVVKAPEYARLLTVEV